MYHHLHLLFLFPISFFFFLEQNKTKTNKQNICLKCSIITDAESYLYDESKSIRQPIKPSDFLFFSLRNSYHLPFIYLFLYSLSDKRNIERKLSFVVARFSGTLSKRLERESNLFSWLSCFLFLFKEKRPGVETRATPNTLSRQSWKNILHSLSN